MYFKNKNEILTFIENLEKRVKKYENKIIILEKNIYLTMKKPIEEVHCDDVVCKWNNKVKAIKQQQKGIRRLKRNIVRFKKNIHSIKSYHLENAK